VEDWREEESSTKGVNGRNREDREGGGAHFSLPHPPPSHVVVKHGSGSKMAVARL